MREARHFDTGCTQRKTRNADRNAKWNGVLVLRISEDHEFGFSSSEREGLRDTQRGLRERGVGGRGGGGAVRIRMGTTRDKTVGPHLDDYDYNLPGVLILK